ncbi:hypothetical protein ABT095_29680 [Kitasatospora sp. NPDC002227]|uniref:hypothetical protein n=1 Tax=Kitasatospora sp. NPDC002227 TaxID=3154773 RepID=UPI003323C991
MLLGEPRWKTFLVGVRALVAHGIVVVETGSMCRVKFPPVQRIVTSKSPCLAEMVATLVPAARSGTDASVVVPASGGGRVGIDNADGDEAGGDSGMLGEAELDGWGLAVSVLHPLAKTPSAARPSRMWRTFMVTVICPCR